MSGPSRLIQALQSTFDEFDDREGAPSLAYIADRQIEVVGEKYFL
jgi:hypothetical protein